MRISTAWQAQTICGRAQSIEQPSVRLEQGMPIEDARMVVRRRWRRARHGDGAHHIGEFIGEGDRPRQPLHKLRSCIKMQYSILVQHYPLLTSTYRSVDARRTHAKPPRSARTLHTPLLSAHLQWCHMLTCTHDRSHAGLARLVTGTAHALKARSSRFAPIKYARRAHSLSCPCHRMRHACRTPK